MKIGQKIVLMFLAVFSLTVLAGGVYAYTFLSATDEATGKTFKKLPTNNGEEEDNIIEATEPFTILLMGVDVDTTRANGEEGSWEGRSDSMILLTINPKTKKTVMMSLTRDILVEIASETGESSGTVEKLNHSYSYGQAPMTIKTVEKMLDIKIDRYAQINMDGLMELVDVVGGITVNNELGFTISIEAQEPEYTATIEPGEQLINGSQSLVYARMRYDDPEGDVGRQKRQREVISAIVTKLLQLDGFTQYKNILDAVSTNMQTDVEITSATLPSLLGYRDSLKTIETYQLDGEGAMIDGISYQLPTAEHLLEMQNVIKTSLGQEPVTELKTNVKTYEYQYGLASPVNLIDAYSGTTLLYASGDYTAPTSVEEPTYEQ